MLAIATADGHLTIGAETFRAALGRAGVRSAKQEGDGATPLAALPLRQVLYRPDRGAAPICAVPVEPLSLHDGWCDDPDNAAYNQRVRLPIHARAERLWRDDPLYDIIGLLGWNDAPIRRGRGSAIFLHIARQDFAPTDGCIALAGRDLRRVLALGLTEILVKP